MCGLPAAPSGTLLRSENRTSPVCDVEFAPRKEETDMPNHDNQHDRHGQFVRCALCDRRFGLIRYYRWRTALCSTKCVEHFKARREGDSRWLSRFQAA
jgi:hypothetical protein